MTIGLDDGSRVISAVTLDQLRTLVVVVEEGSFSAGARRLGRVQSAVSQTMATLENLLDVRLWDRSTKIPTLTEQGRVILAAARRVAGQVDELARVTEGLSAGLEPQVSLVVDAVFPVRALVDLGREFTAEYPTVELYIHTETLSAVTARVLDDTCRIGVAGPAASSHGLEKHHIGDVRMIPVCAPEHPLAAIRGRIATARLAEHVQIVLSERGGDASSADQAVLSPRTWRIADLRTKHELLRGGLGWGNMPEHAVREDIDAGKLARLRLDAWGEDEHLLSLSSVYRPDRALGPATRWVLSRIEQLCQRDVEPPKRRTNVARQRASST